VSAKWNNKNTKTVLICLHNIIVESGYFDSAHIYTADEYIALLNTMSDHISLPTNNREALESGIRNAILRHGNIYKVNSVFQLYMGRKP